MGKEEISLRTFEIDLLPMLTHAARESAVSLSGHDPTQRNRRWRRAALIAAAGFSLAVIVPLFSDDPLRGALAIETRRNMIHVRVDDASADPEAMTNDLRAQGLPARVEVVPVSPSLEGRWVDIWNDNLDAGYNDSRFIDIVEQLENRPKLLKIPVDFSTPFTVVVGRPAEPSETYRISTQEDTETAYVCLGLADLTPADAAEVIERNGYEALWYYEHSDEPYTEVLHEVPIEKVVVGAEFLGPATVIVHTADPDSKAAARSAAQGGAQPGTC